MSSAEPSQELTSVDQAGVYKSQLPSYPDCRTDQSNELSISSHADLRWVQRAHDFDRRLERAWEESKPVSIDYRDFDQVRYDSQTETLLCVRDNTIVTVLRAAYEDFDIPPLIRSPLSDCFVCGNSGSNLPVQYPAYDLVLFVRLGDTTNSMEDI